MSDSITPAGLGLVLNWLFVTVGFVAWLGWWEKIRLSAPVNRRALVLLLPFAGMVSLPVVFGMAIPEISLVVGQPLPDWAMIVYIVLGVVLEAANFNQFLYRGVLLRALEPPARGRLIAGVVTAVAFAFTHFAKLFLGSPA